jgi:hypothetical protein
MENRKEIEDELEVELNRGVINEDTSLIILKDITIEEETYFIFFYDNQKFIETGDLSYRIAGNAPIIVNKLTGEKFITGTALPLEYYIDKYKKNMLKKWDESRGGW